MASTLICSTFSCKIATYQKSNSTSLTNFRTKESIPFLINNNQLPRLRVTVNRRLNLGLLTTVACSKNGSEPKEGGLDWPILKRWDVPWPWQTISLTSLACGICYFLGVIVDKVAPMLRYISLGMSSFMEISKLMRSGEGVTNVISDSFVVTGLVETEALPYLGINIVDLSLDEKAELLFLDQGITTAAVLGVLFSLTKSFQPLPDDLYRYDLREPFNLKKGWLLWAAIGFAGALGAIALTGVALSLFGGESPERETDALVRLLPLIGSSKVSTFSLLGITGILAPLLEETIFRGFFMASMTKWIPTPIAVIISAAAFAVAHLTPGELPQLFVLGTALGFSYAQTRNLMTPITIHSFWNSGVILLLTFLQLQGYDIKELLSASQ